MILINCTNCKAQLSIDDAFAGGACRCQYCGTIQTVPKRLKTADGLPSSGIVAKTAAGQAGSSKSLYRGQSRANAAGSGLDAIAEAVASSSGLSGSGLTSGQRRLRAPPSADELVPQPKSHTTQLLVLCAVVIILLLGVLIGVLLRSNGTAPTPTDTAQLPTPKPMPKSPANPPSKAPLGPPTFLGTPLNDPSIIFVLDRGDGSRDTLEYVKFAAAKTLRSLRPDQKFQIIFWKLDNEKDPLRIPAALSPATDDTVKKAAAALDSVIAYRQSDLKPALNKAFAAKPAAVVITTAKLVGGDFAKVVLDARKDSTAKVYCLSLNAPASAKPMTEAATKTGGSYRNVTLEELQSSR